MRYRSLPIFKSEAPSRVPARFSRFLVRKVEINLKTSTLSSGLKLSNTLSMFVETLRLSSPPAGDTALIFLLNFQSPPRVFWRRILTEVVVVYQYRFFLSGHGDR